MDSAEFQEWKAYLSIEPIGEERDDLRAALVPYMLACAFSKKSKRVKFADFILSNVLNGKPEQTPEEMLTQLKLASASLKAFKESKRGNTR